MATTSDTLSATGSVTLDLKGADNRAIFGISGTYGTVTAVIEGTTDGTIYQQLAALRLIDQVVEITTIEPSDNTTRAWAVQCDGFDKVRFRVTAIASGSVLVRGDSFQGQGPLFTVSSTNSLSTTELGFVDGVTAGTAAASKAVVLDASKDVATLHDVTLESIVFSGATGACEVSVTDNLADALSIKIAGGADLLILDSTNSNEKATILSAATQKLGFFGTTPAVQPATEGTTTGFTAGSGTAAKDDSTFTGGSGTKAYTVGDIVLALKTLGIMAAS